MLLYAHDSAEVSYYWAGNTPLQMETPLKMILVELSFLPWCTLVRTLSRSPRCY